MDSPASDSVDVQTTGSGRTGQYGSPQMGDTPDIVDQNSPSNDDDADQPQKPIAPMQKRRRVTRACDECRRKKIKCDGKQPCTHCTVYSYECTYDQPSNRRRNAAPQYIEALETQLKRSKAILSILLPTLDLNDPNIDLHLQNGMLPQLLRGGSQPQPIPHDPRLLHRREEQLQEEPQDSHLESMVKATGQLDLDEDGNWDYHGHSSGLSFMRRLQQQFGDVIAPSSSASSSPFAKFRSMSQVFDSPSSAQPSPADSTANTLPPGVDLPTKEEARKLCDNALIDAGALLRVVHMPSFYKSLDRMYETSPENYGNTETTFLPLLYAVLALGTLFSKKETELDEIGYEASIEEGFKYFRASRQLLDIADCRDLTSLQAIVFMIQFLQSSAKLSTCYAYIGVALRAALRMGLHRSFNVHFNPIEAEIRKRLFWTIRKMDTYVGAMLGLPNFLADEEVDQDWPTEVDDEYITETEIRPMPEGKISVIAASNAHTKIVQVLAKICRNVYPIKGTQSSTKTSVTYTVSYSQIREIEQDLQRWLEELPLALRPGGEGPPIIIRVQQLLRMAYGHAQLLLYRPFLHYVSQSLTSQPVDQRAFACANACISVSRNIIHITVEMKRRGLLIGAYWFSMYTTFFAIISILYFVLENPDGPTSHDLFREAQEGKEVLAHFAKRSLAADRCTATLNTIFEKLPEKVTLSGDAIGSKKRRQGSSPQSLQSRPNMLKQDDFVSTGIRRASTFPESMPNGKRTTGLPLSQAHLANLGMDPTYGHSPSQSSSDMFDPVPSLTPTSSVTSNIGGFGVAPIHTPHQRQSFPATPLSNGFVDGTSVSGPLSDLSAMMFPSSDPFAYPNQPMTTYENTHAQEFGMKINPSPSLANLPYHLADAKGPRPSYSPVNRANVPLVQRHPNEDVQLFGPMPMYLMHGAQMHGHRGFNPHPGQQNVSMTGTPEAGNMNFDDLFGGEEWATTFMDQGLGLNGGGSGFAGGNPRFAQGGPHRANWQ